jgi:4-diphosphocytidyl-2-C-methyl-D-erythritol kinase
MLTVYAPAKINLVLEVLSKDNDYHRISSIVQAIDLCDILNFQLDEKVYFECDVPSLKHDNLVTRAAYLLKESTKCSSGARIELCKHIPWGVGLGGGSSDAATALLALNELWGLRLPLSELARLASYLGSDVSFFIHKGTALIEGKGERVTQLSSLSAAWFVLLVPPLPKIPNKTKQMYNNLEAAYFTEGQFVRAALSSLRQGKAVDYSLMFNVFERVAFDFFSGLDKYRRALEEAGAPGVYLAGSGPCLFTFFTEGGKADELVSRLKKQGLECYLASSFPNTNIAAGL